MEVSIQKFKRSDIPYKVQWVNDKANNTYLHYNLPLEQEKTLVWYESIQGVNTRGDFTIYYGDKPVGLVGLLNIDFTNRKAEYYILLGDKDFKGKGVASKATKLILEKSFTQYELEKVYLHTEVENVNAQVLFEKNGFTKEGLLRNDLIQKGRRISRYIYSILKEDYYKDGENNCSTK